MTGYIWLCEKCHGQKVQMLVKYGEIITRPNTFFDGRIYSFSGTPIEIISCTECDGRGYWEPK